MFWRTLSGIFCCCLGVTLRIGLRTKAEIAKMLGVDPSQGPLGEYAPFVATAFIALGACLIARTVEILYDAIKNKKS